MNHPDGKTFPWPLGPIYVCIYVIRKSLGHLRLGQIISFHYPWSILVPSVSYHVLIISKWIFLAFSIRQVFDRAKLRLVAWTSLIHRSHFCPAQSFTAPYRGNSSLGNYRFAIQLSNTWQPLGEIFIIWLVGGDFCIIIVAQGIN